MPKQTAKKKQVRVYRTERRQPATGKRGSDQSKFKTYMARFVAWEKADTITGATVTGTILTFIFLLLGGVEFAAASMRVAHVWPYLFLFLTVYYCMDKAMYLMKQRKEPLLDPEKCVGLSTSQMIVIGVMGNLASGGFILISIIITLFVMATFNPEAFRELMMWLEKV